MNSVKWFCMLTAGILILSSCGKTEKKDSDGSAAPVGTDRTETDFEYPFVAKSEDGYYFFETGNSVRFLPRLMFLDNESGRIVPLCNRPDCAHEDWDCNAYFPEVANDGGGIHRQYLQYEEGSLYAVGLSEDAYVSLFRIKADGSAEWEISAKLYRTDYAATKLWQTPEILIVDGYVYFVDWSKQVKKLERMPVDGGTSEVVFEWGGEASAVHIRRMERNGENLFFQVLGYSDDLADAVSGVYCYDLTTGQSSLVKEGLPGPYSVQNGFMYYGNSEGLCRYSIQEGTTEILADQPMNAPNITLTKDYIILCDQFLDGSTLNVYNYEGEKITTVPNTVTLGWYYGGDSDMLFGQSWKEEPVMCFLDLTRPVTELQWEE
ncbi:MAG: DUF5050 domain-containing protein [Clostridium sp.]|nr:DUF5050 domain-containing protein [Clostridium sp.]